jgi:hypothetical protein
MAKSLILNIVGTPVTLPDPFSDVVLGPGRLGIVVDGDVSTVIAQLGGLQNIKSVLTVSEAPDINPIDEVAFGLVAAAKPRTTFVFRPGDPLGARENVHTDWATLVAALATVQGRKLLEFDNSFVTPTPISIPAGGPYDMTDVVWTSIPAGNGPDRVIVEIADGATFTKLREIRGFAPLASFEIKVLAAATAPVDDFSNRDIVRLENVLLRATGGAPFFSGAGLGAGGSVNFHLLNTNLASTGFSVIDFPVATTTLGLNLWDGAEILLGSLGVGAAASVEVSYWGSPDQIAPQAGVLGTRTEFVFHPTRLDVSPDPPAAPLTANPKGDLLRNTIYRVDGTVAATYVLPLAAEMRGLPVVVKDVVGGALAAVGRAGADTIDGGVTAAVPSGGSVYVVSDGLSNWMIV